jgi:hypothetical protein
MSNKRWHFLRVHPYFSKAGFEKPGSCWFSELEERMVLVLGEFNRQVSQAEK